jgi:DNA invertase Pin-like site-specific DNA recombinase
MPGKAKVKAVSLSDKTRSTLSELARSRTAPAHHVERSAIILHLADQRSASETASAFGIDRQRVTRCARRGGPRGEHRKFGRGDVPGFEP